MDGKYDDILHMEHHVSPTRKPMPLLDRAAQFAPFAALTGYGDQVEEMRDRVEKAAEPKHENEEYC